MNEFNPGFQDEGTYTPDKLHAGDHPIRSEGVTILAGQVLTRGALLGIVTVDGKAVLSLAAAQDGSEEPWGILGEDIDATAGDQNSFAYIAGDFNQTAMTFGTGHTPDSVREGLRDKSIYLVDDIPA
jgi:hypothetical protein